MDVGNVNRIVVKLGTDTVMRNNQFNMAFVGDLARQVSAMVRQGQQVIIVSSGAIGLGLEKMHKTNNGLSVEMQQAMAAVGQTQLMKGYEEAFGKFNQVIAQVLLTQQSFEEGKTAANLKNALEKLLELNIVPVLNENDAVATEELVLESGFSDNDVLAAKVAVGIKADLAVMASSVGGLYTENPATSSNAKLVQRVSSLDGLKVSVEGKSLNGRGGFETKLRAADIALKNKVPLIITKGNIGFLEKIMAGEFEGTLFEV